MARLILKSPFIKGGGKAGRYAKYIGTRKGVELLPSGYAEYMEGRPRSHGLFGDEDHVDLKKVAAELDACEKNVWTHIVSLKREDATRLGYDNAKAWRDLIRAHRNDIAAAMNIPPNDFRWCAAFHDAGEHPHIHMMAWSASDAPGYLSKTGIKQIKSTLTNDIFRHEMLHACEQKSQSRDELVAEARRTMLKLADEMKRGVCEHSEVEQLMQALSRELKNVKGKKQYGYLPKSLKKQVDEIVDQMARLPYVKNCYEKWLELQQEVNEFYSGKPMEMVPLSQQKEFRAIHNAVIQAAVQMGQIIFEDRSMEHSDEPDDVFWYSDSCRMIWSVLCDDSRPLDMKDEGVARLHSKAEHGEPLAQLLLGRLYRDGPLLTPDWLEARYWFEQAAQTLPDAQYALGKLVLTDDPEVHDREQGLHWLMKAAENGHDYAAYRLGKELIKDRKIDEALPWLKMVANADNPYAEYLLGKSALAKKAGITHQTVSQAMKGRSINEESAAKIAAAVGLEVKTLFTVASNAAPLAPATIRSYHRTISSILEKAVKWQIIPRNPAENAELPSNAGHKARYLDEPDAKRMLQLLQDEPIKWRAPIIFDLLSGLRRAELLGLRWQDVNLDDGVIRIVQTSNYVSGKGVYVDTPKTADSDRYLKVSRTAILILLEYKSWQDEMREKVGDAWQGSPEDDRVFTNDVGRPWFPTSLTQWMGKFIKRTGLPSSCVHSLRHTYASLLIADGTPLVVVSKNLGHAQTSTTSDIYSHVIASAEAKAAQVTDKFAEDIHPKFTPKAKKESAS